MSLRSACALALLSLGCAGPARVASPEPAPAPSARPTAADPAPAADPPPAPTHEELLHRERRALAAGELLERPIAGGPHLHLVLEASRCYRLVTVADPGGTTTLQDEHGHRLREGAGRVVRLGPVCPRWTGSFTLSVGEARRATLLLAAFPPEPQPSASSGVSESTDSSTR